MTGEQLYDIVCELTGRIKGRPSCQWTPWGLADWRVRDAYEDAAKRITLDEHQRRADEVDRLLEAAQAKALAEEMEALDQRLGL